MRVDRLLLAIVGVAQLLAAPASALEWAAKEVTLSPRPLQRQVDARFTFRNTAAIPVEIRSVQTNCDCLNATTSKTIYVPGESGELQARFTTGERDGLYERAITVVTSESPTPQRLTVRINVPRPALVEPVNLLWPEGAAIVAKPVEVTVADGIEINFAETYATNGAFTARLEVLAPGRRYRVHVTPKSTAEFANAAIRIAGRTPSGEEVVVSAYANVR